MRQLWSSLARLRDFFHEDPRQQSDHRHGVKHDYYCAEIRRKIAWSNLRGRYNSLLVGTLTGLTGRVYLRDAPVVAETYSWRLWDTKSFEVAGQRIIRFDRHFARPWLKPPEKVELFVGSEVKCSRSIEAMWDDDRPTP